MDSTSPKNLIDSYSSLIETLLQKGLNPSDEKNIAETIRNLRRLYPEQNEYLTTRINEILKRVGVDSMPDVDMQFQKWLIHTFKKDE